MKGADRMDERYMTRQMGRIWCLGYKHATWLKVELAVLRAKAERGEIPQDVYDRIKAQASYNNVRIAELDDQIHHDFLAFVMSVQESLDTDAQKDFHGGGMTTFDCQEPEFSLRIRESIDIISQALQELCDVVKDKAIEYKNLIKIESSHGQHAEPIPLGQEFLWWWETLGRQQRALLFSFVEMGYAKISGAVGTYTGGLSLELEKRALEILDLEPAPITGQIVLRDRHARVISTLAILAGVIENVAENIWLMAQTEKKELEEPFKKDQKGSSRMPHKRNPILDENLLGLARIVRSNVTAAIENIKTRGGRDISHSSVERIIFPESFHVTHFMILRLTKIIKGLVVHPENIERNMRMTHGVIFSPDVKEALMAEGIDPETAYRLSQQLAFQAIEEERPYLEILMASPDVPDRVKLKLDEIFDVEKKVAATDAIYERCGVRKEATTEETKG